jgi:transcriptional regulator with XRE-family HTH domain
VPFGNGPEILLLHLCRVIDHIRNQIKKRRAEKRLTQTDVALDLGITPGAYSKIESGPTEISITKLEAIAAILEVDIAYFFEGSPGNHGIEDQKKTYGFATKTEMEELAKAIQKMKQEIASLKAVLQAPVTKKKRKS